MRKRLQDNRGETLVEVLASILIGALSVSLLFGTILVSSRMDRGAEQTDETFHASLRAAEDQTVRLTDHDIVPSDAKVTVINEALSDLTKQEKEVSVNFYGGKGALSYALPAAGGGAGS